MTEPESPLKTKRQALPWPWWRRLMRELLIWPFDLDDGTGDGSPSLTKIMAWIALLVACIAILRSLPVTGTQVTLIIIAISAAFGRSIWRAFLQRGSWSQTASDSTSKVTSIIRQEIAARRKEGADDGTEPTA